MTGRMTETAKYYLEGPKHIKGNLSASMREAGYSLSYANTHCDTFKDLSEFKRVLELQRAITEEKDENSRVCIDKSFESMKKACIDRKDYTNAIRCCENMAKHRDYYKLDRGAEDAEDRPTLSQDEIKELKRLAALTTGIKLHKGRDATKQAI